MNLIAVAPNGARKTKDDVPTIPLSPEEIAIEAEACLKAGAGMIHLHVRDKLGRHSLNIATYQEAIKAIRDKTDNQLFIQVTSEAVGKYTPEEQFEMIHGLKPDAVSISVREIRKFDEIEINENFNFMRQNNIYPQIILYNAHDSSIYKKWLEEGILPGEAYPVLLVVGKAQVKGSFNKETLKDELDMPISSWMVCGFGDQEFEAGKIAAKLGGHIRLGFENNHLLDDGSSANSNADLIEQMANHIKGEGKKLGTYMDAQNIMKPIW